MKKRMQGMRRMVIEEPINGKDILKYKQKTKLETQEEAPDLRWKGPDIIGMSLIGKWNKLTYRIRSLRQHLILVETEITRQNSNPTK